MTPLTPLPSSRIYMDNRYLEVCVQEVVLALLGKEPSRGYQLRAGLTEALGEAKREANRVVRNLNPGWDWGKWTCDL